MKKISLLKTAMSSYFVITLSLTSLSAVPNAGAGKTLTGSEIQLLNATFEQFPVALLRINLALKGLKSVLADLENPAPVRSATTPSESETALIKKHLATILDPVRQFFVAILDYKALVKPILSQSLGGDATKSLLVSFCAQDVNNVNIEDFCLKNITTREQLLQFCQELSIFFSDLNFNMTPKAKEGYQALLKQLHTPKK